jgi:hypothetical protein
MYKFFLAAMILLAVCAPAFGDNPAVEAARGAALQAFTDASGAGSGYGLAEMEIVQLQISIETKAQQLEQEGWGTCDACVDNKQIAFDNCATSSATHENDARLCIAEANNTWPTANNRFDIAEDLYGMDPLSTWSVPWYNEAAGLYGTIELLYMTAEAHLWLTWPLLVEADVCLDMILECDCRMYGGY